MRQKPHAIFHPFQPIPLLNAFKKGRILNTIHPSNVGISRLNKEIITIAFGLSYYIMAYFCRRRMNSYNKITNDCRKKLTKQLLILSVTITHKVAHKKLQLILIQCSGSIRHQKTHLGHPPILPQVHLLPIIYPLNDTLLNKIPTFKIPFQRLD